MRNCFAMSAILLITLGVNLMTARQVEAAQTTQFELRPGFEVVDSISQLRKAMARSGGKIRVKPGVYQVIDAEKDNKTVFFCTGSDNYFDMRGVTIQIDTMVLANLRGKVHSLSVYRLTGNNLTFEGGVFEDIGDNPPSGGIQDFSVFGDNCTFKDCTFIVRGSSPYGYGDLLGKGGRSLARLQKHCGVQIMGTNTTLEKCKVICYAFGHCYFVQGGINTTFLDCYAEGRMRPTDEMLKETSGPAFNKNFASVWKNRAGKSVITPGYIKSLCEDGFRFYSHGGPDHRPTGKMTLINCKAKNTRGGFQISGPKDGKSLTVMIGCEAIECEHSFLLGENMIVRKCKGDAKYGPLLYLRGGENSDIELELTEGTSEITVHALATIAGDGHRVQIYQHGTEMKRPPVPIMLGYYMPYAADAACPIPPGPAKNIDLINTTGMPLMISKGGENCAIRTNGRIDFNQGKQIRINTH